MSRIYKFFFSNFSNFGGTAIALFFLFIVWNDAVRQAIVNKTFLIASELIPLFLTVFVLVALVRAICK